MEQSVGDEVRDHPREAVRVPLPVEVAVVLEVDLPARMGQVHLVDDARGDEPQVAEAAVAREAAAHPETGEVEHLIDHRRDATRAGDDALRGHGPAGLEPLATEEQRRADLDRGERVSEVMAQRGEQQVAEDLGLLAMGHVLHRAARAR